jgi:hypothetical protein
MTIDTDLAGTESLMSLVLFPSLFFLCTDGPRLHFADINIPNCFLDLRMPSEYPFVSARKLLEARNPQKRPEKRTLEGFLNLMLMKSPNRDITK